MGTSPVARSSEIALTPGSATFRTFPVRNEYCFPLRCSLVHGRHAGVSHEATQVEVEEDGHRHRGNDHRNDRCPADHPVCGKPFRPAGKFRSAAGVCDGLMNRTGGYLPGVGFRPCTRMMPMIRSLPLVVQSITRPTGVSLRHWRERTSAGAKDRSELRRSRPGGFWGQSRRSVGALRLRLTAPCGVTFTPISSHFPAH